MSQIRGPAARRAIVVIVIALLTIPVTEVVARCSPERTAASVSSAAQAFGD
jgi:hypothetical protein